MSRPAGGRTFKSRPPRNCGLRTLFANIVRPRGGTRTRNASSRLSNYERIPGSSKRDIVPVVARQIADRRPRSRSELIPFCPIEITCLARLCGFVTATSTPSTNRRSPADAHSRSLLSATHPRSRFCAGPDDGHHLRQRQGGQFLIPLGPTPPPSPTLKRSSGARP
jgi:hypothetical protein